MMIVLVTMLKTYFLLLLCFIVVLCNRTTEEEEEVVFMDVEEVRSTKIKKLYMVIMNDMFHNAKQAFENRMIGE